MKNIVVEVQYMNKPILRDKTHGGTICHIKEYLMEDCFVEGKDEENDRILFNEIKKILETFEGIYSIRFFLRQRPDTLENLEKEEEERENRIKEVREREKREILSEERR